MRTRSVRRFSDRPPRNTQRAGKCEQSHILNGIPTECHEDGAPELPPLPDEFNRFAPIVTEEESAAKRRHRLHKMLMYLMAAGALGLGLMFPGLSALTNGTGNADAEAEAQTTAAPASSAKPSPTAAPTPNPTDAATAAPTATLRPTSTPEPTAVPTQEPTPEPEVEGVELLYAEWVDFTGESAVFSICARIPKKNIEERGLLPTEMEVFAWLNGMRTVDDWDAINTLEVTAAEYGMDVSFGAEESGDIIVTYTGTLYWADHPTPAWSDLVTIAVCGVFKDTWELTDPSNSLTVGIGGKAYKYNTNETP